MILENWDKLKDWLSVVLEPLCDADSSALARYVIALLKKDKSDKDLKRIMIEQLDVFLSEETTRFVDRLFDAIASEEYLTMPAPTPVATLAVSELELDHDLEVGSDIEAVLAAVSSPPPPPPPKVIVIKLDGNQQQQQQQQINNDIISREPASEASSAFVSGSSSSSASIVTDANTTGTQSTKPAFDHKTKDSHKDPQQQQLMHHSSGSSGVTGIVRSASPPLRSSGGPIAGANAADKENQPRDSRRRRASLRSRSRSRSRSNERSFRRSRSRDRRINEREKSQRQFRNKSPPCGASDQRHRRNNNNNNNNNSSFDRRRIGNNNNNSNSNNNNMDDRGQRFGGSKGRHSSRSRSISPESRNARRGMELAACSSASAASAVPVPPAVMHPVPVMPRQRCRDFDEKGYCVRGETCPWDHGINPVVFEGINNSALMMSMREYNPDAPEIWARGGPPGVPGVVPAGGGNPQQLPVPPQPGQTSINPFSGNVRACAPLGAPNPADYARQPGQAPPVNAPPPMMPFPFNPTAVTTPLQRQLIPIPVMDGGAAGGGGIAAEMGKRRFELEDSVAIADVPSKMRKVPINSRLGPRVNPNMQQHNSSLELRKVPRGLNTIAHLNNHFAKFGKIVNIQVSYEGDPEAAIVTFSTHAEANVAYRSTEAVLNNRFIKVFWHNDNNSNSSSNNSSSNNINNNESAAGSIGNVNRKSQYHLHNVPAVPTPNADSAKIINNNNSNNNSSSSSSNNASQTTPLTEAGNALSSAPSSDQALASTAAPSSMRLKLNTNAAANATANGATRALMPAANVASIRKKQEEQQKAMHQLANGLRKRKQELLQSYVKQMKTALELVERMDQQDVQRAPTLETIKVLQATIDRLRKDVHADQDQLQAQIQQQQQQQQQQQTLPVKKTKEQQKRELLDMELELFAQQQEGNDTTAIQKRLEELQRTLSATIGGGNISGGAKLPGGGARKRSTYPEGSTRVDRRPKAIVVTGFAAEEADFVLGHFKHFGEISKHDVDREIPQLILSYATRLNAEQAVLRGKMFKDKRLQISWAPVVTAPAPAVPMGAPMTDKTPAVVAALAGDKMDNPKHLMQSVSESESLLGSDTLPELRLEDEEEDEESEDRSWRR
ncbi:zinc finger protein swm [Drosophila grimshawi]|uniref:GH11107 n=1 Tax=Drosophila grimshawi TaxID=7222 RepID=B4JCV9_DROGR|nr:zinc finger protein swm [Drosophila grimshawi]EDW03198.1 GH11107 [Drosophila grimshawi]